jgi:hypothetical protein
MKKLILLTCISLLSINSFAYPYVASKWGFITNDYGPIEHVDLTVTNWTAYNPEVFFEQRFSDPDGFGYDYSSFHPLGVADWLDFGILDAPSHSFYRLDYEATDVMDFEVIPHVSTNWGTNIYYVGQVDEWFTNTWIIGVETNFTTNTWVGSIDVEYRLMGSMDMREDFSTEMFSFSTNYPPNVWSNRISSAFEANNRKLELRNTKAFSYVVLAEYYRFDPVRWPGYPWYYVQDFNPLHRHPQATDYRVVEYYVDLEQYHTGNVNHPPGTEPHWHYGDGEADEKWADVYYRTSSTEPWIYLTYKRDCRIPTREYLWQLETRSVPETTEIINIVY